jgi:hypothetical protein
MRTTSTSARHGGRGFALLITIVFLAVVLLVFASVMYWVSGNAKVTERNNQYVESSAAAEAAVEMALSAMDRDFLSQSLTNASYYASLQVNQAGWPIQYNFSDPVGGTTNNIYVLPGTPSTNTVPLGSQYAGLYGLAQTFTVAAKATPKVSNGGSVYNVPATVTESVTFASIPIFQFAIFYNIDLEIAPGATMAIAGPVFSNRGIWASAPGSSAGLTFSSTVQSVDPQVNTTQTDPFANNYSSGNAAPTFSLSGQPVGNCPSLVMPIGTNNNPAFVQTLFELPPPTFALGSTAAYSTNGQFYLANGADLYVSNSISGTNSGSSSWVPSGTNTFVFYQDGSLQPVTPDYYILRSPANYTTNFVFTNLTAGGAIGTATNYAGNVRFAGYSFITNVLFYDWREGWNNGNGSGSPAKGKAVQAVQINITNLNYWLTNFAGVASTNSGYAINTTKLLHSGHYIDSIYVYTSVLMTNNTLPAVRVANGSILPTETASTRYGFTVATQFPIYVLGDYNSKDRTGNALGLYTGLTATAHTYPAALMGDSVTILSDSWNDSIPTANPDASSTTVNAAMLCGIVQTDNTISGDYSGGVENFLRLLENWGASGGQTLTYNGSIVVMYPSQYATNHWNGPGSSSSGPPYSYYYGAPTRHWAFDINFRTQSKLPPLTPQSKALIRGQWMGQ